MVVPTVTIESLKRMGSSMVELSCEILRDEAGPLSVCTKVHAPIRVSIVGSLFL